MELTDQQWNRIEPIIASLAKKKDPRGRRGRDPRDVLNGVLWILRTGAPWRDLPSRYGKWQTVSSRFYRWRRAGIWEKVLAALQSESDQSGAIDWEVHFVDGTIIRAHQHAAGAKKQPRNEKR